MSEFNGEDTKPTKSGVYKVRTTIRHAQTNEEAATVTGYAYFSLPIKRWSVLCFDVDSAWKKKYTTAWHLNADQKKEWKKL